MSQPPYSASTTLSPLQQFARLPTQDREKFLATLSDEEKAHLAYRWRGWIARANQEPPPGDWRFWLIKAGRGFGKTRIGAETTREWARDYELVNIIGATANDARDIMIEGESGILAVCPPWERPTYQPSKRQLAWPNGSKSLIFTADEPERLRGKQHMRLWADEIASWRYPEAWDQAMFGLRLGQDPRAVVTSTPKPTPLVRDLITNPHTVVTNGTTYDNVDNLAPAFADEIIRKYEGTRLGRQELLGELLEDEGLAYRFSESIHIVDPFDVPGSWLRFESMDYGSSENSATAWLFYAVDYDGNVLIIDEMYQPGLPSDVVPLVEDRRARWNDPDEPAPIWADPAIFNPGQTTDRWGRPAVVADEFRELGVNLLRANNDRRAGYIRISEMLKVRENRPAPVWARHLSEAFGTPHLYVFSHCRNVIEQLKQAPIEESQTGPYFGPYPGEAVAQKWERTQGHAHASLRYGLLTWPVTIEPPKEYPSDPRARALVELVEREELYEDEELDALGVATL